MEIINISVGLVVGLLIGYMFFQLKQKSKENEWIRNHAQMEERIKNLQAENEKISNHLEEVEIQKEQHLQQLAKAELKNELSRLI